MLSLLVCFNVPQYTTVTSRRHPDVDPDLPRENRMLSAVVEERGDLLIVIPAQVAGLSVQQHRVLMALTARHGNADVVVGSGVTQQRLNTAVNGNRQSSPLYDITEWPYNDGRFARRFYPSYVRLGF